MLETMHDFYNGHIIKKPFVETTSHSAGVFPNKCCHFFLSQLHRHLLTAMYSPLLDVVAVEIPTHGAGRGGAGVAAGPGINGGGNCGLRR